MIKKPDYFINTDGWLVEPCPQLGTLLYRYPSPKEIEVYAAWLDQQRIAGEEDQSFDRAMDGV